MGEANFYYFTCLKNQSSTGRQRERECESTSHLRRCVLNQISTANDNLSTNVLKKLRNLVNLLQTNYRNQQRKYHQDVRRPSTTVKLFADCANVGHQQGRLPIWATHGRCQKRSSIPRHRKYASSQSRLQLHRRSVIYPTFWPLSAAPCCSPEGFELSVDCIALFRLL